jgi:glycosyltransferase involved in cell wall biosynthesis
VAAAPAPLRGDECVWHNPHNGLGVPVGSGAGGAARERSAGGHSPALVVTVHDLIPMLEGHGRGGRPEYVRAFCEQVPVAVERAQAVIAVSEQTRGDLVRLLGVAPERITVISEAARRACRPPPDLAAARGRVAERYGIHGDYGLYLGGFAERKNVGALVEAYAMARARRDLPPGYVLAIAGAPDRTHGQVCELAHRLGCADGVRFLGHVPEGDLAALYGAASVFLYPSLYEGFGLPPLEAMACGAAVICSEAASLPEVCKDAALLVDARQPELIAAAMARVAGEPELRQELRRRGLARAGEFSWRRAAAATLAVYQAVYQKVQRGCGRVGS